MKLLSRNSIPAALMACSMLMLAAFIGVWLRSVYHDQRELLLREAENIFAPTIRTLQDSLVRKIVLAPEDTSDWPPMPIPGLDTIRRVRYFESNAQASLFINHDSFPLPFDSLRKQVRLMVSTLPGQYDRDAAGLISSVVLNFQSMHKEDSSSFELGRDSLHIADIQNAFEDQLHLAGLDLPFEVRRLEVHEEPPSWEGLSTTPIRGDFPLMNSYQALFSDYGPILVRRMAPQIAFSAFLFLTILVSFLLIYRSWQKQRQLAALKNDFISNVTHELKTPIATVSVAIEALRNFNALSDPEKTREYLDISHNELNRLSMLVDKVLKMSIFERKEPDLNLEPLDLREMVQTILDSMKLQFENASAQVEFHSQGEDFSMQGDRIHLTSVVYNLLDNALKYSNGHPEIQVELQNSGPELTLSVADKGVGIAPEYQSRIFEKFFRAPTGDTHNIKGHGLGLTYVAGVVRKHGGAIELESRPGKGSRFVIRLPKG
jgi:two-component system, OmpR family, phosphate regulon sensor histidine kinase PhoR